MIKKLELRLHDETLSALDKLRHNGADKFSSRNSYLEKILVEFLLKHKDHNECGEKTT